MEFLLYACKSTAASSTTDTPTAAAAAGYNAENVCHICSDDDDSDDRLGALILSSRFAKPSVAAANNNTIPVSAPKSTLETSKSSLVLDEPERLKKKSARKICSTEGCTNIVVKGGVCIRHGAKVAGHKICTVSRELSSLLFLMFILDVHINSPLPLQIEGCTSQARKGKLCVQTHKILIDET